MDVETGLGLEERLALEEVGSYPHPRLHMRDKVGYSQVVMPQHLPEETKPPNDYHYNVFNIISFFSFANKWCPGVTCIFSQPIFKLWKINIHKPDR